MTKRWYVVARLDLDAEGGMSRMELAQGPLEAALAAARSIHREVTPYSVEVDSKLHGRTLVSIRVARRGSDQRLRFEVTALDAPGIEDAYRAR